MISGFSGATFLQNSRLATEYSWPGNIRELRNVIEHAFIIESSDYINLSSLPETVRKASNAQGINITPEQEEGGVIDFTGIQNSVLDKEPGQASGDYNFQFATQNDENELKMDFQEAKDLFEKEFIIQALKINKGKINQTALKANIPKKTLLRKIEKYGINPKEYY